MKKKVYPIVFLLLILCFQAVFAQPDGSLVKFSELSFKNDTEKAAFEKYNASKETTEVFDLLFRAYDIATVSDKTAALQKIENYVSYLKKKTAGKQEIKKVKIIYDYVHKLFLKMYKEKNGFMDIFAAGEYNCLSASALYAIIFSKLSVPYQVKETPSHVYLIAYPNTAKIMIETTSPAKGYYQFSSSFVNNFVKSLYESKQISKAEYESAPATDLFNKHYFTSESISLFELCGLQYSNFALYSIEEENLKNANEESKKALFIFPGEKHKYILKSTLAGLIAKSGYADPDNIPNLVILCRFSVANDKQITNEVIKSEFYDVLQAQLIKSSNYDAFERSYKSIRTELADSALKSDIGFIYHYELARLGFVNSKSPEYLLGHLSAAYKLNPLNANLRSMILAVLEDKVRKMSDAQSVMAETDSFALKYDFIKENDLYFNLKANCFLDFAYHDYFYGHISKGDAYIKQFEEMMKVRSTTSAAPGLVEKAYAQATVEYYKKGNYAKAKKLLETGLIYAPNNYGLQHRLSQLK